VSFQSPLLLLALGLIPLLAGLYVATERRRRRAAAAFAAPATSASVTPRRPRWRRHVPLALAGLAMAGLIAALARPQVSVAVPAEQASIVLVMDHSSSMQATDVTPTRLAAARSAAEAFLAEVPREVRVGGVVFDHRTEVVHDPTTDRPALRAALVGAMAEAEGGTASGDALAAGLGLLEGARGAAGTRAPGAIVLLSDGTSTSGLDPLAAAQRARDLGVPVYTVSLGTDQGRLPDGEAVPPDPETMAAIAERSGGATFAAADTAALQTVYERLGSQVTMREEQREVTGAFAGGAIALLLGGAALSLRWFRRLL
jgi:Ca-activated chloride channel family protein